MIDFADDAQDLIAGYRRFRANRYREARDLFRRLRDGQEPATMIIACADSRVDPAHIFDVRPGKSSLCATSPRWSRHSRRRRGITAFRRRSNSRCKS